jgi:hypothetical protein
MEIHIRFAIHLGRFHLHNLQEAKSMERLAPEPLAVLERPDALQISADE